MIIVGITGGVATGKSTVAGIFAEMGAPVVSADEIAREVLEPGSEAAGYVLSFFPECRSADLSVPDSLDRRALAKLVFENVEARRKLEEITHPPIIARLLVEIALMKVRERAPLGVAEIPLLFETDLRPLVDLVVVTSCPEELQIERLMKREIDRVEAKQWIDAQMPLSEKIALADHVVDTDSTVAYAREQVNAVWGDVLKP